MYQSHYGFVMYAIGLLLFCGCFLLIIERRTARSLKLKKEERLAAVMGWINVFAGIGLWVWRLI